MNPTDVPLKAPETAAIGTSTESDVTIHEVEKVERALIDASTRLPVLFFYASAIVWLLLGTLLAGLTSWKLHAPDMLADYSFLTWGRVRPAHMNVMVWGWASMAGIGTAIWLMARLCRTTLRHPLLLIGGGAFWNLGVMLGVGGILAGGSTGYQWLEFPSYASIVLFVAYTLVVSWAVIMFRFRKGDHIYITQWYLLGAFLWFPWVYGAAQIALFVVPVQGVMQAAVNWWFANNLLFLWFGSIGLGTAYYMIPKVIGRPVYSYHLAAIGFWTYALFASWTGMQRLVDGPFPAWMITASIAATILTIIPVATVGLNHHMTMRGYFGLLRYSPTLRFTVFGAISYTVFSVMGVLISLRSVARYVDFTQASIAYSHMGLYAFFTMVIFGSMYYIVPRLVGREWRYASLIKLHFWSSTYGVGLMVLMLFAAAIAQGSALNDPGLTFMEGLEYVPMYLRGRSLSGVLLTVSHCVFAFHFGLMLFGLGRTATVPTFLNPQEEEALEARL
jgi:cytochrome c oxidase cbb3-type subunit I